MTATDGRTPPFPTERSARPPAPDPPSPLLPLAALFLRLGSTAFGGPAAHIALMEDEVVRRRRWLTRDAFLDYLGATNLIPGPNSTELALHVGRARAGWPGLLVAGLCFILPSALLVSGLAWAHGRFGAVPQAQGLLRGVQPVILVIVLQALWALGRSAVTSPSRAVLGVAALAAAALGVHELAILAGAGTAAGVLHRLRRAGPPDPRGRPAVIPWLALPKASALAAGAGATAATAAAPVTLWGLFGVLAKIGAVLFGSGYVLIAFLRADLVERLGWLSEPQLLAAVAAGQLTPGPLFTTATFIGYLLGGPAGAAVATVGIFLPAFVFVALSGPLVPRLRRSPVAAAVLDGVTVASLALMATVTVTLARAALVDPLGVALAALAALLLVRGRVNSAWLVLGGAVVGTLAAPWLPVAS